MLNKRQIQIFSIFSCKNWMGIEKKRGDVELTKKKDRKVEKICKVKNIKAIVEHFEWWTDARKRSVEKEKVFHFSRDKSEILNALPFKLLAHEFDVVRWILFNVFHEFTFTHCVWYKCKRFNDTFSAKV